MSVSVSALVTYPVKSLAGNTHQQMSIGRLGPEGDRRWLLVNDRGEFVTQRQFPQLSLVSACVEAGELVLSERAVQPLRIGVNDVIADGNAVMVRVWRDEIAALDAGDVAALWCSRLAGVSLRLCYLADEEARSVDPDYGSPGDVVSFADGFPFLLINEASLSMLGEDAGQPLDMRRFRPNIVVSGADPFAEDEWRRLRIGDVEFDVVKPCSRCVIPSINPATGEREADIMQVMKRYRRDDGVVYFGQNLIHRGTGSVAVGAGVTVLE